MASVANLPVHLVEEIFLRLDDTADLVRASAACAAFRRVVSDGRFLRRFRSLHRRPVLGLLHCRSFSRGLCFHPAEPPRRSALAAAGLSSSSFLRADPTEHYWHVHDARDGRVLLSMAGGAITCCLPSSYLLVVYDSLHRKHVGIPPIPKDIVARYGHYCCCGDCEYRFNPFLVPAAADEDDLSFRVICTVLTTGLEDDSMLESFVYSSVTGKWRAVASLSGDVNFEPLYGLSSYMQRHYAHGCFYWVDSCKTDMLVLDMNEMKFSVVSLPPETRAAELKIVVEAAEEDSRIGLLVVCENTLQLYSKAIGGGASDFWQRRHDAEVTLPGDSFEWLFGGVADQGYALIQGVPRREYESWDPVLGRKANLNAHYFTVELQATLVVEKLCVTEFDTEPAFLYASFPPSFAPPCL